MDNGVALVTISRPPMNAMDIRLHWEVGEIWKTLDADDAVKVSVVTGGGDRAFSAGGDVEMLDALTKDERTRRELHRDTRNLVRNMIDAEKPIVSAINGAAVGAGLVVALLADISICSKDAALGDGHVKIGVAAGDHATLLWPAAMGFAKAKFYLLTGETMRGVEAERLGLVSECHEKARVLPRALEVAALLANGPQHAVRATKHAVNQQMRSAAIASLDYAMAVEIMNFSEEDGREGVRALKEKRKPRFPSALERSKL